MEGGTKTGVIEVEGWLRLSVAVVAASSGGEAEKRLTGFDLWDGGVIFFREWVGWDVGLRKELGQGELCGGLGIGVIRVLFGLYNIKGPFGLFSKQQ